MNTCFSIVKTTDIKSTDTQLTLIVPDQTLYENTKLRICFAQTPPEVAEGPLQVEVSMNGTTIPVAHCRMVCAPGVIEFLYSDQLAKTCSGAIKARQYIDVIYGSDTGVFTYVGPCRCLNRPNINYPSLAIPE